MPRLYQMTGRGAAIAPGQAVAMQCVTGRSAWCHKAFGCTSRTALKHIVGLLARGWYRSGQMWNSLYS